MSDPTSGPSGQMTNEQLIALFSTVFRPAASDSTEPGELTFDAIEGYSKETAMAASTDASKSAEIAAKWSQTAEAIATQIELSPNASAVTKSMARQAAEQLSLSNLSSALAGNAETAAGVAKNLGALFGAAGAIWGTYEAGAKGGASAGLAAALAAGVGMLGKV